MGSKTYQRSGRHIGRNYPILLVAAFSLMIIGVTAGQESSFAGTAKSDQGILEQLNSKLVNIENRMTKAEAEQVPLLSPNAFLESFKNLSDAKAALDKGKDVKTIRKKLERAEKQLTLATRNTREAKRQLPDLITAREDALAANAPEYAPELYEDAEGLFTRAMAEIEDNDINGAIKKGRRGQGKFRESELKAIKASIIDKVYKLLEESEDGDVDEYAPLTFSRAQSLLQEAEEILNTDRKAQSTARKKAEEAQYEINHAIYIAGMVRDYRKDDNSWERFILSYEDKVKRFSEELNFKMRFDTGLEKPLKSILLTIASIKEDKERLTEELREKNVEIKYLSSELNRTRGKEASLKGELAAEKRRETKIKRIELLFDPSEAIVIREGPDVMIRLVGLSFAPGKAEIEAEYFRLLTKVQRAIREFPDCRVVIEGHTDSIGHESINMQLSTRRASAVKTYLLANMGLPDSRIGVVGYGESRPIASNENKTGRSRNRRIDVVLEIVGD